MRLKKENLPDRANRVYSAFIESEVKMKDYKETMSFIKNATIDDIPKLIELEKEILNYLIPLVQKMIGEVAMGKRNRYGKTGKPLSRGKYIDDLSKTLSQLIIERAELGD